jgi:hypothetical protein
MNRVTRFNVRSVGSQDVTQWQLVDDVTGRVLYQTRDENAANHIARAFNNPSQYMALPSRLDSELGWKVVDHFGNHMCDCPTQFIAEHIAAALTAAAPHRDKEES